MLRMTLALVAALCLTALAVLLIAGHGPWSGRTLFPVAPGHGINVGDLPVFGFWGLGVAACAVLARPR
ncbi:hypothetical protein [Nocardioides sp. zg-DK7169]|uniref:hypothetical protein n=1 Tax=Nocardioides sp. zg-DK7169 TaxID=2736600 RepID=UPI00155338A0|nr:hypothetical protein [Nocardioides sp. zg-DK7169]NPC97264.1 hypothetical protein [Nocardioides sp. zg-DK7169]